MLRELLALTPSLWVQVGGMSSAISVGVFLFSIHQTINSNQGLALIGVLELLVVLFSVSTFSIYLTKRGFDNAEKLGLRKILGASGFRLFIEVAVRTSLLIILSIIISIGIMDVSTRLVGLSFEYIVQSIGVLHFGALLLLVFLVFEGVLFIIIGVALAPNLKGNINKTTTYEKYWFTKLEKLLSNVSIVLSLLIATLLSLILLQFTIQLSITLLLLGFYGFLVVWCLYNKQKIKVFNGDM